MYSIVMFKLKTQKCRMRTFDFIFSNSENIHFCQRKYQRIADLTQIKFLSGDSVCTIRNKY